MFSFVGTTSCRDLAPATGPGAVAPSAAALSFSSRLPQDQDELLVPIRTARVRLFRLPGETPERAVLDSVIPFGDNDSERTFSVALILTMASERFGLELSLLDDRQQVVYLARDTVIAYTGSARPPSQSIHLRYVGADTAVTRVVLSVDDAVIPIGEPTPLHANAFLRDGRVFDARFGYAVHGSSAMTVDASGTARASGPVPRGSTWIVARIATGLADSIAVAAADPAASIALTPKSGRIAVGGRLTVTGVPLDARGAPIVGRAPTWSSSDSSVASVDGGIVIGRQAGSAIITARAARVSASVPVIVGPMKVTRVVPSTMTLGITQGSDVGISVEALDDAGFAIPNAGAHWSIRDTRIATLAPSTSATSTPISVHGVATGLTTLDVEVDGVRESVSIFVEPAQAAAVMIVPRSLEMLVDDSLAASAIVRDGSGKIQPRRGAFWRSLDPAIVSVDAAGKLRALATGRASIVAAVDKVADTILVTVRRLASLTITRVGTLFDQRGEVATFAIAALDQSGAAITNLDVTWSVSGGATLVNRSGTVVQVVLQGEQRAVLTVTAHGVSVMLPIRGGATPPTPPTREPPKTVPVTPPSTEPPQPPPAAPPLEPKH